MPWQLEIRTLLESDAEFDGYAIPRRTLFRGRWIRHGGFYPDPKLRLFRRGSAEYELRPIQKKLHFVGKRGRLTGDLVHSVYPTLGAYIERMDRYSTSGAARAANLAAAAATSGVRAQRSLWLLPQFFFPTIFSAWGFSTDAKGCWCTCITPYTQAGSMPGPGSCRGRVRRPGRRSRLFQEFPLLKFLECLPQLLLRVHHDGAVPCHGFLERFSRDERNRMPSSPPGP